MVELRRVEVEGGLYGRLLQRLALALDEADSVTRLHHEAPRELELHGLTSAELQLIRAYLDQDLNWLQGWHAAAEELAVLERRPARVSMPNRSSGKPVARIKPLLKRRQQLCCALCANPVNWLRGQGVQACSSCGSQLFRAGTPLP